MADCMCCGVVFGEGDLCNSCRKMRLGLRGLLLGEIACLECADTIETSEGTHKLWTPADVALVKAFRRIVDEVLK